MSHAVQSLLRVGRNTTDLDRATAFYRDALGFRVDCISDEPPAWAHLPEVDAAPSRCARLSLGAQPIELTEFPNAEPYPPDSASCDLWFQHLAIVVDDMHAAYARVLQHGAIPVTRDSPQTLPPSTGSVTAFKFRDPDGHPLELIAFPNGVGDPVWQSTHANGPTLGIDHSAISVSDVARSIAFYEGLGLRVVARGLNRGAEQQRLDDLAEVAVEVIALQPTAARTPHVELLGYRQPRGRAAAPMVATAVACDRLVLSMRNLHITGGNVHVRDAIDASCDANVPDGDSRVAWLRDPDGHWIVLA